MQLIDKDLLSMQEVRELVEAAKEAQQELARMDQAQVDRIVRAIADAGVRNARRLAQMANEDTGFGIVDDKVIKNIFASRGVYEHIKDMKTIGEISRDDAKRLRTIAVPVGVIAGLIPSTNPTSTALYKAEIAIKAGNAIVFSPHPTALRCILETVKVIRQAVAEAGGNENLVSCITIPTMEATDNLMRHRDVAMILATGGSAMVRAAYSSGTPAIGVGPGNGPAYLEKTCDLPLAVKRILDSKTFDNGTICASEQSIICDDDMVPAVKAEMERQGAYFLDDEEREKLGRFILRANGTMNPEIVGRSVKTIANLAGLEKVPATAYFLDDEEREKLGRFILRANGTMNPEIVGRSVKTIANLAGLEKVPATARVLVAKETGVGRGHPYSNEKLGPILAFYTAENYEKVCEKVCEILHYEGAGHTFSMHTNDDKMVDYFARRPILAFYTAENYEKVCEKVCEILHYEGAGHTFSMHTNDDKMVDYFARRVPASRVMVNTPSALGGIGGTTALQPALTLGCGAVGGSATSENVGPMHLLNLRYVAYGLKELDEIRASVPDCSDGVCRTAPSLENIDVDDIVRQIIGKLQKL